MNDPINDPINDATVNDAVNDSAPHQDVSATDLIAVPVIGPSSQWLRLPAYVGLIVIFCAATLWAWAMLRIGTGFPSNDDFYHARISALIIEQRNIRVDFPWLPLTILNRADFVDHHLLYHIYLAPWSYWGGAEGVKVGHALILGALFAACLALLRMIKVDYAFLWTCGLLAVSTHFLFRLLMIRTQAPALLVLVLLLIALLAERPLLVGICVFAFTWLYNGFILAPIVVGIFALSMLITEQRWPWWLVIYGGLGMIFGLVVNPYFPANVLFIASHLGEKVNFEAGITVGREWYPYTTGVLLGNSPGALAALAAAVLAPSFRRTGRDLAETTLLLVALTTLYMLGRSSRFIEYFPAFALLVGAAAWGRRGLDWRSYLDNVPQRWSRWIRWVPTVALAGLAIAIAVRGWVTVGVTANDLRNAPALDYFAGAAGWLSQNTPKDSLVFTVSWDIFPHLFYHNTHNAYLMGLDPTYFQERYPKLWTQWQSITNGSVEKPAESILKQFGARYVISDPKYTAFVKRANADAGLKLVYQDAQSLVWQVVLPSN